MSSGLIAILWFTVISAGFLHLIRYQFAAGEGASTAPEAWPAQSKVRPHPDVLNLVLFAHPKCPCTRATIGELSRLMARCQGRVASHVLFLRPGGVAPDWEVTDLWESAAIIPGVEVLTDLEGVEANLFRAVTSGQVLVYGLDGRLAFEGGITASRGHAGDNPGRDAIVSLATRRMAGFRETSVFGCCLSSSNLPTE
ncbi:MAG TPA: hypothetical protein VMT52_12615 [Planctomycetota bacterium]|nr:hypothetical protein [Planctomycetota bacterium]